MSVVIVIRYLDFQYTSKAMWRYYVNLAMRTTPPGRKIGDVWLRLQIYGAHCQYASIIIDNENGRGRLYNCEIHKSTPWHFCVRISRKNFSTCAADWAQFSIRVVLCKQLDIGAHMGTNLGRTLGFCAKPLVVVLILKMWVV